MQEFSPLDGAILIDKPAGPTSHDVVDAIRRQFGIKKVGHCGTLDPNATGLLIIVLGRGTKLSEKLMGDDKVYEGTIKFGEATDSYDADGEITETKPVPPLTLDQLNEAAADVRRRPDANAADGFGHQKSTACRFTNWRAKALKSNANRGWFTFTISGSPITSGRWASFRIACTKGTYVRSIAHELGQKLGCGAHLATLRRTASGKFDVAECNAAGRGFEIDAGGIGEKGDSVFETGRDRKLGLRLRLRRKRLLIFTSMILVAVLISVIADENHSRRK